MSEPAQNTLTPHRDGIAQPPRTVRRHPVSFRLVVEFAPSHKPALCAGMPRTTELTTSF